MGSLFTNELIWIGDSGVFHLKSNVIHIVFVLKHNRYFFQFFQWVITIDMCANSIFIIRNRPDMEIMDISTARNGFDVFDHLFGV